MLGKLLKYELRATGRQVLPLCGAMVLYAALCRLLGALRITRPWPRLDEALASIGTFFFILLLFACCVASNIVLVVRYYRNLYGDEGYLMNTLPVTPAQNIWAKLISAFLWEMAVALSVFVSLILLLAGTPLFPTIGRELGWVLSLVSRAFALHPGSISLGVAEVLLLVPVSALSALLMLYAAISLGQFIRRHRVLGAVAFYFVLDFAFGVVTTLLFLFLGLLGTGWLQTVSPYSFLLLMWGGILLMIAAQGVVCFGISRWCLSKKLELE